MKKNTPEVGVTRMNTPGPPAERNEELPQLIKRLSASLDRFTAALEAAPYQSGLRIGFADGIRHVVTVAEEKMAIELGLASREELANSKNKPAWWTATLVNCFFDDKPVEPRSARKTTPKIEMKTAKA